MSSIGIDFGNDCCVIGLAGRGGIDIVLNEGSNRRTPSMVSFQGKQRFMGESALSISRSNFKNTARELKRLIGRQWEEPELQEDLKRFHFSAEKHPKTGGVGVRVLYGDNSTLFSAEQLVAMMLTKAADIAKAANSNIPAVEAVVSIPGWYTDAMRHAMLDACHVAGLKCLRLLHESTATALAYGIYRSAKGQFSDGVARNVLFLDLGHSSFCASVVSFVQATLTVKATCYDRCLGGRDMDYAVAEYLAEDFYAKTNMDARSSSKSMIKLLDAAEKAKKTLSPIGVVDTTVNIECLVEEKDYNGRLTLEKFEQLISPLVQRLSAPVIDVLREANISLDQLDAIEIVGGATRVPMVKKHLASLLKTDMNAINYGLSCTMNADEAIARGCALQCAILSSRFRVKQFDVVEAVPYSIRVCWEGSASVEGMGKDEETENSVVMFKRNDESPKLRRVTLKRNTSFVVKAIYDDISLLPPGVKTDISSFKINVPESYKSLSAPPTIRIYIKHDLNGIISLQSVQLMEEIEDSINETAPPTLPKDEVTMDVDSNKAEPPSEPAAAITEPAKKKFRKVDLSYQCDSAAWTGLDRNAAVESEAEMAYTDRIVRETSNRRNELEAYIYSTRDKIADGGDLTKFISANEMTKLSEALTTSEDWLYSDEGFDSTIEVYSGKLQDMQVISNPIENRLHETMHRDAAITELRQTAEVYKRFANSRDEATAHISDDDKNKVREKAAHAEEWIFTMQNKQSPLPLYQDPVLKVADIKQKVAEMHQVCKPIVSQPKPVLKPVEEEKAAPVTEPMDVGENKPAEAETTPMEEDKPTETEPMDEAK